jgi:hypothetical protein
MSYVKNYKSVHSRIIGRANLGIIDAKSITDIHELKTRINNGDILTIIPVKTKIGITNVKVVGNVKKRKVYGEIGWIPKKDPVICERCSYNKNIERGDRAYVLHPRADSAQYIHELSRSIPDQYSKETIDLALDVSGDEKTDILAVRYCRDSTSVSPDSMSRVDCVEVMRGYRFTDGKFKQTYKSMTPPYD